MTESSKTKCRVVLTAIEKRRNIVQLDSGTYKDSLVNSLLDNDHYKLRTVIRTEVRDTLRQLDDFKVFHHSQLTVADSITEHKDVLRKLVIHLEKQRTAMTTRDKPHTHTALQ